MKNMIREHDGARLALFIAPAAFIVVLLGLLSNAPEPVDPYCEMVGIWIDSNGEYGWPDYRGNYHEACPAIPLDGGAPRTQGGGE